MNCPGRKPLKYRTTVKVSGSCNQQRATPSQADVPQKDMRCYWHGMIIWHRRHDQHHSCECHQKGGSSIHARVHAQAIAHNMSHTPSPAMPGHLSWQSVSTQPTARKTTSHYGRLLNIKGRQDWGSDMGTQLFSCWPTVARCVSHIGSVCCFSNMKAYGSSRLVGESCSHVKSTTAQKRGLSAAIKNSLVSSF